MKRLGYLTMAIVMLLALLPAAVVAQETHYFTWTPNPPAEGGTATFTTNYPGTYYFMVLKGSLSPGNTCDYTWGMAFYPSQISVTADFNESGDYLFCLDITLEQGGAHVYDNQTVSVTNMPPFPTDVYVSFEPSQVGESITARAFFNDYDPMETWNNFTCTVDYGDGTGVQPGKWWYPFTQYNDCEGPAHTYTTAGTYTITFRVYEPGVADPGIGQVTHVVESAGPSGPGVKDITITSKPGRNNYTYTGLVTIGDDQGPLSKVAVTADWWLPLPDGSGTLMATQTASTNRGGVAKFTLRAPNGTYDLCVTQLVKTGYEFPPDIVCYSYIYPQ